MEQDRDLITKLCNLEIPSNIKISPGGDRVLYSTSLSWGHIKDKAPVSTLWLATPGKENSSRKLTDGSYHDLSPAWHPWKPEIAFVSDRAGRATRSAIYKISATGDDDPVAITPTEKEQPIETFKYSPDGKMIAFISKDEKTESEREEANGDHVQVWGQNDKYSRLRIIDLDTKQTRTLSMDKHILEFCWIPVTKGRSEHVRLCFVSSDSTFIETPFLKGTDICVTTAALDEWDSICSLPSRADGIIWGSTNLGKGYEVYFRANTQIEKNFSGTALYRVDLGDCSNSYEQIRLENDVHVKSLQSVDGMIVVACEHRLQDCIVHVGSRTVQIFQQEIEAFDIVPESLLKDTNLVIATSNINKPMEVYSTERTTGNLVQLSQHGKILEGRVFGTYKVLTCPTTDDPNVEVDGIYLEPAIGQDTRPDTEVLRKKSYPTIILVHGGPLARVTNAFNALYYMMTPFLLSKGYGILLPNYRGSSGRGEEFSCFSYGRVGTVEYLDTIALTQYAVQHGYADPDRLVIAGYSHGGLAANLCALWNGSHGHGWRFKAAISGAGISDIDGMSLTSEMGNAYHVELQNGAAPWTTRPEHISARHGSALWTFKVAMERDNREGTLSIPPMLIVHGEDDKRIHVSQAWGMRRAFEQYCLPFEMAIYPGQGHIFHKQFFWIDFSFRISRWLERYIGPGRGHSAAISLRDG